MKFSDIIGQAEAKQKILDSIHNDRLAHALLLTGPEGVGQMAMAHAIAQYVNCHNPSETDSCGKCPSCLKIQKGVHPDFKYVLPIISKTTGGKRQLTADFFDGFREHFFQDPYYPFGSWQAHLGGDNKQLFISVHEIRELKKGIYLKSFEANYKVVIIWNAERINVEGANAFLKLLEEPPERTLILMTCSDPGKLLTTINSRCQRIQMGRLSPMEVQHYLVQYKGMEAVSAQEIASIAEGSIGNASEYLNDHQSAIREIYTEWLRAAFVGDFQKIQAQVERIIKESKEFQKLFLKISIKKMRDSLLFHLGTTKLALVTREERAFQEKFATYVDLDKVDRITAEMESSLRKISGNAQAKMVLTALSLRTHSILRS
ncbi:DNA polymerase III subunit delta' [Pontibacter sp. G13]|uniref:DNA polymerase III subunit delta' n=1 Tax=Pontibacter sp. G13 TaxID=3074898 RepID=UPI00288C5B91|nr:DNA polymerase III subunit delta' [Pontibacter sp. G13]WNJ15994.1 DNA polymerase III subunit delta' [Pontibacter sp. G13]